MNIIHLLQNTIKQKASDLHITAGVAPMMRIDGKLVPYGEEKLDSKDIQEYVETIMDENQKRRIQKSGQVDFAYSIEGWRRFRVNAYRQRGSYAIAFRFIPDEIPTLKELNLPEELQEFIDKSMGLVLVTGSTGSGKSTTLASLINIINEKSRKHILTLEDPIEYLHSHKKSIVNQREIRQDTTSYADGLRAALRQDPDVILIGEMRDLETISTAITAAETGHLVLSTLHTIGAAKTIDRIINVFSPYQQPQIRMQLSSVLQGVISQQLIRRKDQPGRIVSLEIMKNTPAIQNLIREGKTHQIQSSIQMGRKWGMITMDAYIRDLYRKGIIAREEALLHSIDLENMKNKFLI